MKKKKRKQEINRKLVKEGEESLFGKKAKKTQKAKIMVPCVCKRRKKYLKKHRNSMDQECQRECNPTCQEEKTTLDNASAKVSEVSLFSGKEKTMKNKEKENKKEEKKENKKKKENSQKKETKAKISNELYEKELRRLQIELVKLQDWVREKGLKVLVIFEGRDAAGKGGAITRITEHLNPRFCKVVALAKPTERERSQWYFQRYVEHLPAAGEIVLFDRSWYNRAGVERVFGFCTDEEYEEFLRSCPQFEEMLIRSGIILIKYWFSVSDEVQEKRMQERIDDPLKTWKFSDIDLASRKKWVEYSKAKDKMFERTDTYISPWNVVESDIKKHSRLNCIAHLLSKIPYEDTKKKKFDLPKIEKSSDYTRPDIRLQKFVPDYAAKVMEEQGEAE